MPHKLHHTTVCLNCGERLKGRYCYKCGQDNLDHQDTVWHLVKHFFEDITHYDGKLWQTIHPLLTQPGFITQQFLLGKRASYLNPVRLFIFLNFIFFFLVLSLPTFKTGAENGPTVITDKAAQDTILQALNTTATDFKEEIKLSPHVKVTSAIVYQTPQQYDSAQLALEPQKRDSRLRHYLTLKWIGFVEEVKKDPAAAGEKTGEIFLHNAAKLTFLFVIICSCLLYLLYYRQHRLMVNHALFAIHLACTFLLLSIAMLAADYLPFGTYLVAALFLYGNYYFYRSLRVVYGQGRAKTALKFVLINLFLLIGMSFGLLANALVSLMSLKG